MLTNLATLLAKLDNSANKALQGKADISQSRLAAYHIGKIIYGMNSQSRYFVAKLQHGQTIPFFEPPKAASLRLAAARKSPTSARTSVKPKRPPKA